MIQPGSFVQFGLRRAKKRSLTYTRAYNRAPRARSRRGKEVAPAAVEVNHETVAFDHGPSEFPVATVVPRQPIALVGTVVRGLEQWLRGRWAWFRPRTIPVLVAVLGCAFVLMSADYLSRSHPVHTVHYAAHLAP